MGLDCSHDAWHGAYSAFSRFRNMLAEASGHGLKEVDVGYGVTVPAPNIDYSQITEDQAMGKWSKPPEDIWVVLFAHSDCEGSIAPREARLLADAMEAVLPSVPDGSGGGHLGDYCLATTRFISGLRSAAAARQRLRFR